MAKKRSSIGRSRDMPEERECVVDRGGYEDECGERRRAIRGRSSSGGSEEVGRGHVARPPNVWHQRRA